MASVLQRKIFCFIFRKTVCMYTKVLNLPQVLNKLLFLMADFRS